MRFTQVIPVSFTTCQYTANMGRTEQYGHSSTTVSSYVAVTTDPLRSASIILISSFLFIYNMIQPTISLEMPVPSQGHYGFHSFPFFD
jgi:hypothetical protein